MSIIRATIALASLLIGGCAWAQPEVGKVPGIIGLLTISVDPGIYEADVPWLPLTVFEQDSWKSRPKIVTRLDDLVRQETDYESRYALLVLERRKAWFRIAMKNGTGWVPRQKKFRFSPIEEYFTAPGSEMDYLIRRGEVLLASAPGRVAQVRQPEGSAAYRIVDRFLLKGKLWLKIEIFNGTTCSLSKDEIQLLGKGWVPLMNENRLLNFWWHTRGC